jgi:hypothetical protein
MVVSLLAAIKPPPAQAGDPTYRHRWVDRHLRLLTIECRNYLAARWIMEEASRGGARPTAGDNGVKPECGTTTRVAGLHTASASGGRRLDPPH